MRRRTKFLAAALIVSTLLVLGAWLVPWRELASQQLHRMLRQATGQNISFTLAELGLTQSTLRDLRLGGADSPVLLASITLAYTLPELWHGRLRQLQLNGLTLSLQETPHGWQVPSWQMSTPAADPNTAAEPPLWLLPQQIPLQIAQLTDSTVSFQGKAWQLDLPVSMSWQQPPQLSVASLAPRLQSGAHSATAKQATAEAAFDAMRTAWQGSWVLDDLLITMSGLPEPPPLQAKGALALDAQQITLTGTAQDTAKAWQAQFSFTRNHAGKQPALLQVSRASMPLLGGVIRLRDLRWPLDGQSALRTTVMIEKLPLQALLRHFTSEEVRGSGTVSGTVPVTRRADGKLVIPESVLQTDSAGTIAIPASYFPGDNPQLVLLRDILTDLHYESLSLTVSSDTDGKLQLKVSLAGHNPAVQNGKPVKLNVNLGGDVLGLLNNQLISIIAPTQLLRNDHGQK